MPIVRHPAASRHSLALPTPRDMEPLSAFKIRHGSDELVRSKYPTPTKRMLAAQQAWMTAKAKSLVSIYTSEDEFLLFGSLTEGT